MVMGDANPITCRGYRARPYEFPSPPPPPTFYISGVIVRDPLCDSVIRVPTTGRCLVNIAIIAQSEIAVATLATVIAVVLIDVVVVAAHALASLPPFLRRFTFIVVVEADVRSKA